MRNNRLAILFVCVFLVVVAGVTWIRNHDQPTDDDQKPYARTPVGFGSEMRADNDVSPAPRLGDFAPSELPTQEAMQVQARKEMQKHESAWNMAAPSSTWSQPAENQLSEVVESPAMEGLPFKPQQVSMRCKATLCRVEAAFPQGSPANEWNTRLLLGMGGAFGASSTIQIPGAEGQIVYVTYAYRP